MECALCHCVWEYHCWLDAHIHLATYHLDEVNAEHHEGLDADLAALFELPNMHEMCDHAQIYLVDEEDDDMAGYHDPDHDQAELEFNLHVEEQIEEENAPRGNKTPSVPIIDALFYERYPPLDTDRGEDYEEYCKTIITYDMDDVIKFYTEFAPNYAIPILRKGCRFNDFHNLYAIQEPTGLETVLRESQYIHFGGYFYTEKYKYYTEENRYCAHCMWEMTKNNDEVNQYYFHNLHFNNFEALMNVAKEQSRNQYWCSACDEFLFVVKYSDSNECEACEPYVKYDNVHDRVPLQFFQDEINFYYSCVADLKETFTF